MKRISTALFLVVIFTGILAAQTVTGTVFADRNGNSIRDGGESGVPGVSVSNGRDVVSTDGQGRYTLPLPDPGVIFVCKPAHYALPMDKVPRFFRLHVPKGSPALQYPGIPPTGDLPKRLDFALIPSPESETFQAVFLGDTQIYAPEQLAYLTQDILTDVLATCKPVFASVLGDVAGRDLTLFPAIISAMNLLDTPVFYVPGNHDHNVDATDLELGAASYQAHFGPCSYAFNVGRVHFVVLDNILYRGDGTESYREGFSEKTLTFLHNDLALVPRDHLVVLLMHAPFINEFDKAPIVNLDRVLTELSAFPHTFSISGHNHTVSQQIFTPENGWKGSGTHQHFNAGAACGDWWLGALDETGLPVATMRDGSPNGYAVVNFEGNAYRVDYKAARQPREHQMTLFLPRTVRGSLNPNGWRNETLYVNFFTGAADASVRFRVDTGTWQAMKRTLEPDPAYTATWLHWQTSQTPPPGHKPSSPEVCEHLWKASVPHGLTPGFHRIEVEALDWFGRTHRAWQAFRVE